MESFYREETDNISDDAREQNTVDKIPVPLYKKIFVFFFSGIVLIIIFTVCAFVYRNTMPPAMFLTGAILGVYLLIRGLLLRYKWNKGRIEEHIYRCVSCKRVTPISVTAITRFSERKYNAYYDLICTEVEEVENPHLYEFRIGRGGEQITLGGLVILYVDVSAPRSPVAFKVL